MPDRLDAPHEAIPARNGTPPGHDRRTREALTRSMLHFTVPRGRSLEGRTLPYFRWLEARRALGIWPYRRVMASPVGTTVAMAGEAGTGARSCLNFGSQDYLGLAHDPRVYEAARASVEAFGVHTAGSPILGGRTTEVVRLEARLADTLGYEAAILYPSGWMAGFGAVAGLVRRDDAVVMDALSHNCLQEGARHATDRVRKFRHNDLDDLALLLRRAREEDAESGLFVVLESLYSMDSDFPDLGAALGLARRYEAVVILDVAHDFGAVGEIGLGLLETLPAGLRPDVVIGAFSKTFAANGGFVATSEMVRDYLSMYSPTHIFSNGIAPMQVSVVLTCFSIAFSEEGEVLRGRLRENVRLLREAVRAEGLEVAGAPSPIVPVFVGDESLARVTSRQLECHGLRANLVEFPAVPRGKARFRFQVMSSHTPPAIRQAAARMGQSKREAADLLRESTLGRETTAERPGSGADHFMLRGDVPPALPS